MKVNGYNVSVKEAVQIYEVLRRRKHREWLWATQGLWCVTTYMNMCPAEPFKAPAWVRLPEYEGQLLMLGQRIHLFYFILSLIKN